MNNLDKAKLGQKPQLLPSKSLLETAVLGYYEDLKPFPPKKLYIFTEEDSLITTVSTGFQHNDKPISPEPIPIVCFPEKNEDSIIDGIDTGFGECGKVEIECPKPKYKTPLYKENYLGEFKSESEKELARTNLGVYSKDAVQNLVNKIVSNDTSNFITKVEVKLLIADLDFVDSKLNAKADYQIPTNLFKI